MSRNCFNPGFVITPHQLDSQLKAVMAKLDEEREKHLAQWADTVMPDAATAFDDLPESRKAEIKRDKWHRDLGGSA
jgi:hypothetical protein